MDRGFDDSEFNTEEYLMNLEESSNLTTEGFFDTAKEIAKAGAKTTVDYFLTPSQQDAIVGTAGKGKDTIVNKVGRAIRGLDGSPRGNLNRAYNTLNHIDEEESKHSSGGFKGYKQRNLGQIRKLKATAKHNKTLANVDRERELLALKKDKAIELRRALSRAEKKEIEARYGALFNKVKADHNNAIKKANKIKRSAGNRAMRKEYNDKKGTLALLRRSAEQQYKKAKQG